VAVARRKADVLVVKGVHRECAECLTRQQMQQQALIHVVITMVVSVEIAIDAGNFGA
jgi:hypothetical protein